MFYGVGVLDMLRYHTFTADGMVENQKFEEAIITPTTKARRHDISIVMSHKFNENFDIGATWVFGCT
ncbi:hypothetical protein N9Y89_00630 [bacterium]|nr:hypothetical protein [bacterium]